MENRAVFLRKTLLIRCLLPVLLCITVLNLKAVHKHNGERLKEDTIKKETIFETDKPLELILKTDFVKLFNDTGQRREYHKAVINYFDEQNNPVNLEVKLRTRGKFRLNRQNCDFPPLKFKFFRKNTDRTIFADNRYLKFVSHCQNFIDSYEQRTLEEYLVYRIYNLISDMSFRVRLAKMTYIDIEDTDTITRFGFFIEDIDQVAARHSRIVLKYKNIKQYGVVRHNMVMLSLFQLMIGNSDWSVKSLHNIYLISINKNSVPFAVPYDFDWAALIGQPYFVPDPKIDPESKYQRIYKGYRWDNEEFELAFEEYNKLKDTIMKTISDFPYLENANKEKCISYILEFYEIINSKKNVRNLLIKKGVKIPK